MDSADNNYDAAAADWVTVGINSFTVGGDWVAAGGDWVVTGVDSVAGDFNFIVSVPTF